MKNKLQDDYSLDDSLELQSVLDSSEKYIPR